MSKIERYIDNYGRRIGDPFVTCEYESVAFDLSDYKNEKELMNDISMFMLIVMRGGNECRVRYEDCGVYVIEYGHDNNGCDDDWGNDRLMWVSSDEEDDIRAARQEIAERSIRDLEPEIDNE